MFKLFIALAMTLSALLAKEVQFNHIYKPNHSVYSYELISNDMKKVDALHVKKKGQALEYDYKINEELLFCADDTEECENTGVSVKKFLFYKNELIFISAILNDKTKVLMIFDPLIDEQRPIRRITGADFVNFVPKGEYLKIKYDGFCETEDPYTLHEDFQ